MTTHNSGDSEITSDEIGKAVAEKTNRPRVMRKRKLTLLADQPISGDPNERTDGLGFNAYARVLAKAAADTPGPFTIGVFGEWGTGKTSLMKLIEKNLKDTSIKGKKPVIVVWFNAWRYESEEHPIVPLVATIVRALRQQDALTRLGEQGRNLLRGLRAIAYGFSAKTSVKVPGFAEIEAGFVAKDIIDRADKEDSLAADPLLDRSLYYQAFEALSSARIEQEATIVVLIDDLDRCFPDKAIKLLESIKLVLAQPGFVFVLGVARSVIEGYLQHRYVQKYGLRDFKGHAYLDKIVQLPFYIPPHSSRITDFSTSLIKAIPISDRQVFSEILPIIGPASDNNPRTIIRYVNNLLIDREIYNERAGRRDQLALGYFAITRILQQRWPDIFARLSVSDELCDALVRWADESTDSKLDISLARNEQEENIIKQLRDERDLESLLFSEPGRSWLANHDSRRNATQFLRSTERLDFVPARSGFENFDLHIGRPDTDGRYPISVLGSPRGAIVDEPVLQEIPLEDPVFQTPILYLRDLAASANDTKELGEWLRQLLFPGRIWELFMRCRDDVTAEKGLRIRLQIDRQAAEIGQLPWEYVYYEDRNEFLALTRTTPIVRYIERNYKVKRLATPHPRILVAMASPEHPDLAPLDENGEAQLIRDSLDGLEPSLDWELLAEATSDKLQKKLQEGFDILHFVGHGLLSKSGVGTLAFEDENGQLDRIDFDGLSVLLRDTGIKLVVLTACETAAFGAGDIFKGVAQSLVRADIPAVIAMQFAIEYSIAQNFIGQLYYYLAKGDPLDRALTQARISTYARERARISWGIPVLYMQSPNGVIWQPA